MRNTEITNNAMKSIRHYLKKTLVELDISLNFIDFDQIIQLKVISSLKILTYLYQHIHNINILKNQMPQLKVNEDIHSIIGADFNRYSIWDVKSNRLDLFEEKI